MTTATKAPSTDLILRVTGGSRDGELISVSTPKCYLGMESTNDAISKDPQCVIFRGREGAVIRSYAKQVMFNDSAASLHWLRKGDTIQFPNAMKIEVVQLGNLKSTSPTSSPAGAAQGTSLTTGQRDDARLVVLESELQSIQLQNEQTVTRFDQLDSRLSMLTEKMTMLINLSNNGLQVSQTSNAVPTPVAPVSVEVPATSQTEEKIINPVENGSLNDSTAVETPSSSVTPAATQQDSPKIPVELVKSEPVESNTVDQVESTSEIKSPSPLEELDRIDKAIEDSKSGYYSHTDDSDEQILTFESDSTDSTETAEPKAADNVAVVADSPVVETTVEADKPAASEQLDDQTQEAEAEAATAKDAEEEAKATADALAEKEQRIADMEKIFGGALTESDTDDKEDTKDTTSETTNSDSKADFSETFSTTQTADEQLSPTFEDLTHGQNAEVDSSADNTTLTKSEDSNESNEADQKSSETDSVKNETENDNLESQLSPMALQLLQDVKAEQEKDEQSQEETSVTQEPAASQESSDSQEPAATQEPAETNDSIEMPVMLPASERVESETVIFPKKEGNESVADILARMKEDGKWDGVPDENSTVEPVNFIEPAAEPEPEVEASSPEPSSDSAGEGDDVEDYMSQLLSRMRGEEPVVKAKTEEKKTEKEPTKAAEKAEKPKIEAPADPLKAEDFKPKHKAKKLESLAAMRELSNSNTQANIQVSEVKKGMEKSASFMIAMGITGFAFAVYSFVCTSFLIGACSLAIPAACAFFFFKMQKGNSSKSTVVTAKRNDSQEPAESTEA